MIARKPGIPTDIGKLVWSKVPEFSIFYNGASVVIPSFEYFLNNVMNEIRKKHCEDNPKLKEELDVFIAQETIHSKYHVKFNQRMYDEGYEGLKEVVTNLGAELKKQRKERSLAFNIAYCAGFESLATYLSKYLFERCGELFEGADANGANLFLWHVAEEFEHRSVCHDALHQVSGSYFIRIAGLLYAFWHVGGSFKKAEKIVLKHHRKNMTEQQVKDSKRLSRRLFARQLWYQVPRMLLIMLPGYHPKNLKMPPNIEVALDLFDSPEQVEKLFDLKSHPEPV